MAQKIPVIKGTRGKFNSDNPYQSPTLPSRYYTDSVIFDQEISKIFHQSWCYVGHVSEIPHKGDYVVEKIADQCLFLIRTEENTIKGFFNACQHRGHELLKGSGSGKKLIVCPYHAWTYQLDGNLFKAPNTDQLLDYNPAEFKLREIAVVQCAGLLFANLNENADAFDQSYQGLEDTITNHLESCSEFTIHRQLQYEISANWKVVVDNFSEGYHIPVAHPKLSTVLDNTSGNEPTIGDNFACFRSKSSYGVDDFQIEAGLPYLSWTIWPNTCMLSLPGCENLIVIRMAPDNVGRCVERVDILAPGKKSSDALNAVCSLFADNFNQEDISIVESVQRGLGSLGYDQGRYVADKQEKWYSESGLHKFHSKVIKALEGS